jgi:SAM-dependent methyltransferase
MSQASALLSSDLYSAHRVLRSFALEHLLAQMWFENPDQPGQGCLRHEALQAIEPLIASIAKDDLPSRDAIAWVLGLLAQASGGENVQAVRQQIRINLPIFLSALDAQTRLHASGVGQTHCTGLLFLLSQFPEDTMNISQRVQAALGAASVAAQSVDAIFSCADSRPERSRFLQTYLGAQACAQACDGGAEYYRTTFACPGCRGGLDWCEEHITCTHCGVKYAWCADIPNLVSADCTDPEEYPEALVEIYESQSRPRFVQVMAADWSSTVTPQREEEYLSRFLHPVDGPVVDLACGAGGWTRRVAHCVGPERVIALDFSLPMLKACRQSAPGVTLVRGSASALPFADASLGGLNCSDALQALPDPATAFAEISRCLRPGAPFTAFTFRKAKGTYAYFQTRLTLRPRQLFSDKQIYSLVNSVGMEMVDMGGSGHAMFFTAKKRS